MESISRTAGFRHRAQLTELMDEPCSRDVLRACLRDIARTNRITLAYRPLLRWLNNMLAPLPPLVAPLRILDVGCGYGDALRRVEQWASVRRIPVELTGLDLNPDSTSIAAEASPPTSKIHWVTGDVLAYTAPQPPHLIISSLFTHHLTEPQIIEFLQWMETHARLGWFISDLARAPIPYYVFRTFAKLARFHRFVQNDGPVSIARAFVPSEWRSMCAAAGLDPAAIEIQDYRPARLCVARSRP